MAVREGFSLIELITALVLLTIAVLGMQSATSRYLRTVITSDRHALATEIARDRIEMIRVDPTFTTLAARYSETATQVQDDFTRGTQIVMVQDTTDAGVIEFLRVTVTVEGPGLPQAVKRSISLARP